MKPREKNQESAESDSMPELDNQPLWIKAAALLVAIGALVALAILYVYRLSGG